MGYLTRSDRFITLMMGGKCHSMYTPDGEFKRSVSMLAKKNGCPFRGLKAPHLKKILIALQFRPTRLLYFSLLPLALFFSLLLFLVTMPNPIGDIVWVLPIVILRGVPTFPIGLWSLLVPDVTLLQQGLYVLSAAGYFVYFALIAIGAWLRSRPLFWVTVVLLSLNVVGCQLERTWKSVGG